LINDLIIGYDILRKAIKGIKNRQVFDESFLMAVATIGALVLAFLSPVVRMLFMGLSADWGVWIYRALTFLVISCPCALVISIPLIRSCGHCEYVSGDFCRCRCYDSCCAERNPLSVCEKTVRKEGFLWRNIRSVKFMKD
jgi:cation transport ATPase